MLNVGKTGGEPFVSRPVVVVVVGGPGLTGGVMFVKSRG